MSEYADDIRPLVRRIGKPPEAWTRSDLESMCHEHGIQVLNLRYPSFDGKLRELRVPVRSRAHLRRVLAAGERVDGSSLFPGVFPPDDSDVYVVPRYRWAFLDPWAEDELHLLCRFVNAAGLPCPETPDTAIAGIVERLAGQKLELQGLAELEFYILSEHEHDRFSAKVQRNYHQSAPYLHERSIADEILRVTATTIGHVKYCHAEVGYIERLQSDDPELDGCRAEQYELELDLMPIDDLGAWLPVARWLVRTIANRHGASVTFAPKLDEGMAGNGMHLHLAVFEDGRNVMMDGDELTDTALGTIGGLIRRVASLAAFGNTVPASYLRLVPGQEAPTKVAWGYRNRGGLVRVPLSFASARRLDLAVNPEEPGEYPDDLARPTVELRLPDGSAYPVALVAAVAAAVEDGLTSSDAVELARRTQISGHSAPSAAPSGSSQLPTSVARAADALHGDRDFYERAGLSGRLLERIEAKLRVEGDSRARLEGLPAAERLAEGRRLMHKDVHKH